MKVFWILRRRKLSKKLCFSTTNNNINNNTGVTKLLAPSNKKDPSRVTKRGYHKLSDGAEELKPPTAPEQDANSSYSGTDYSDYGEEEEEETDSEFDETLTCNVCDRSFNNTKLLAQHQQKKRHFGCSVCESIFPTLMTLEHHKEILDHWSEDEGNTHDSESDDATDDEEGEKSEELERLL